MAGWLPLFAAPAGNFPAIFQGNPNVTITAIDTSGGIVTARDTDSTSALTPYFVQASASAITATGTSAPYEDLEYSWDFGDASGVETFTRPTDGATVNANTGQTGPEAVYVYRSAGTYTITLSIRGKNGGVYTTATKTKNITCAAFSAASPSPTIYYVDPGAAGTNDGSSPTNAFTSISAVQAVISTAGVATKTNLQVLFKSGTTVTSSADGLKFNHNGNTTYTGLRLGIYGGTSNATVEVTSGSASAPFSINNGGGSSTTPINDIVVQNINFKNTSAANVAVATIAGGGNATNIMRNIYLDNCGFRMDCDTHASAANVVAMGSALDGHICKNWGFWNCTVYNSPTATKMDIGLVGSPQDWYFVYGGSITGAGASVTFSHHIYPDTQTHSVYRYISFGSSGTTATRGYCVNLNWDVDVAAPSSPIYSEFHLVTECDLAYVGNAVDAGDRLNNLNPSDATIQYRNLVVERNAMHDLQGYSMMTLPCAKSCTVRYNRSWGPVLAGGASGQWFAPYAAGPGGTTPQVAPHTQLADLIARVYGNRIHTPAYLVTGDIVLSFKDSGWTQAMQITDNILADYRTTGGGIFGYVKADQQSAGSIIDRNQYWAPNQSAVIYDGSGLVTIATHHNTFDLNSTGSANTDPGWATTVSVWSDLN